VLRKIAALVDAGAVVVGARPTASPSLSDDSQEFVRIADRVWGPVKVTAQPIEKALSSVGLGPDFEVVGATNPPVMVLHRHLADGEVYFLSNRKGQPFSADVAFRVTPVNDLDATGSRRPLSYRLDGSRTVVPVSLEANGSALIVFRRKTASTQRTIAAPTETRWRRSTVPGR
jgi:hypothetical protein